VPNAYFLKRFVVSVNSLCQNIVSDKHLLRGAERLFLYNIETESLKQTTKVSHTSVITKLFRFI
jgi:hypothetical protein